MFGSRCSYLGIAIRGWGSGLGVPFRAFGSFRSSQNWEGPGRRLPVRPLGFRLPDPTFAR
eukprot:2091742-Pyramimonas_sp.AAC.1